MNFGLFTQTEIGSQPNVWRSTLETITSQQVVLSSAARKLATQNYIITGCGSTHYLSHSITSYFRSLGLSALALPAAEIVYFPELLPRGDTTLIAISRSGTTTETLWALDRYRKQYPNGSVIAITTMPDSTLAQEADLVISAPDAKENSIAQTRSFTSMYLLAQALGGILVGDDQIFKMLKKLPALLEAILERAGDLPYQIGNDLTLDRFFFLGGGPLYGIANEAMLKTKEMTCSWAEAYHPLEFRHGPMSVINDESLVVGFLSDAQQLAEISVMQDMKKLGAKVLILAEDAPSTDFDGLDSIIELKTGLTVWERGILYLPVLQWIAFHRACAKGLDPDKPVNLSAVVEL